MKKIKIIVALFIISVFMFGCSTSKRYSQYNGYYGLSKNTHQYNPDKKLK